MLLNIDKPLKSATLHAPTCTHVPKPYGTVHKPVEKLGRDGGWFIVRSEQDGQIVAAREFTAAKFSLCSFCLTKHG